jgi:hypothetical protein
VLGKVQNSVEVGSKILIIGRNKWKHLRIDACCAIETECGRLGIAPRESRGSSDVHPPHMTCLHTKLVVVLRVKGTQSPETLILCGCVVVEIKTACVLSAALFLGDHRPFFYIGGGGGREGWVAVSDCNTESAA